MIAPTSPRASASSPRTRATAHHDVLRASEADQAHEPLRPSRPRDHPEGDLGEAELDVVGGKTEVARERELQPDPEDVPLEPRDHGLGAALRRGDVPRELRDLPGRALEEPRDVAAGGELAARAGEDDEPHGLVRVQLREGGRELVARRHGHAVQLPRHVESDRRDGAVALHGEPVVLGHASALVSSRSILRRIFPDALFGSESTKRYSRGRLKRASGEASSARRARRPTPPLPRSP